MATPQRRSPRQYPSDKGWWPIIAPERSPLNLRIELRKIAHCAVIRKLRNSALPHEGLIKVDMRLRSACYGLLWVMTVRRDGRAMCLDHIKKNPHGQEIRSAREGMQVHIRYPMSIS